MNIKSLLIVIILVASGPWAIAGQPLDSDQTLQIFQQLCSHPATGWITQGTIEAMHRTEDMQTGLVTKSTETVVTDGDRFTWQIRMNLRKGGNKDINIESTKSFMHWNQDRTFAWDGQTYTMYFQPGNHAIVYDGDVSIDFSVNGPLTVGHIPWGYGVFSYDNLSTAETITSMVQTEFGDEIHMTILQPNTPEIRLVLDPASNYAVLSYELFRPGTSLVVQTYTNLILHGERYIPMNIQIDRYNGNKWSPKLLSTDIWEIESIDNELDEDETFAPVFKEKALIENYTSIINKPTFHRHSSKADTKLLLDKRLVTAIKKQNQLINCSTATISHILENLGIDFEDSQLTGLIDEDTSSTNLYDMREYLRSKGLYCKAVKTNVDKLRSLKNCQVILHFPANNHFAILDRFDEDNAWIIDLTRQTFYDCMDLKQFRKYWSLGTALLISTDKNTFTGKGHQLPESAIKQITGSGNYSCDDLIQEYAMNNCPDMGGEVCDGNYQLWYERYGCSEDLSGGFCGGIEMIGSLYYECDESLTNPGQCVESGSAISIPIRACQP